MENFEGYVSPLSTRYSSKEMQGLFSNLHRARLFRRLWLYLAEAEKELGLDISDEQIAELKSNMDNIDLARCAELESELRHDVMAHVHAYAELCPRAGKIIHLGATSCYVGDNSDMLIMREALQIIKTRLISILKSLCSFIDKYKALPCLGYTHFQAAQPVTVGKRFCLYAQDIAYDIRLLESTIKGLRPLGCKGTTGTQASFLELFDGDYEKVKRLDYIITEKMGFEKAQAVSGQTYSRKQDYLLLSLLSQIAQSASKFSNDLRLLQHLKEIEEPFEKHQIGSSAMPYKRNPMRCERIAGLARFIMSNAQNAAMTASTQWLERSLDDSVNRRFSLAEGFLATDAMLKVYQNVVSNLVVYEKMIEKHLLEELPFMASEGILMLAVKNGGNRQGLHERIRLHSIEAGKRVKLEGRENDLLDRISRDKAFNISAEEIKSCMSPSNFIGCAKLQAEDFLKNEILPMLKSYEGTPEISSEIRV